MTKKATANTFDLALSLYNSSSTGVIGSQLSSISTTSVTNSALYSDAGVFAGIRNGVHSTGSSRSGIIDNIVVTAVPEPSAALAGMFGMLGLCFLRVRNRHSA